VLHLLAVARRAGVELGIDDFDRISERTPLLCDLSLAASTTRPTMSRAGRPPLCWPSA